MFKFINKAKNQKGFTLVELMVVVVIIGILVAIAVPIYRNVQTTAEQNAIAATERTIAGAYQIFKADTNPGTWPSGYLAGASGDEDSVTMSDWPDGTFEKQADGTWAYTDTPATP